MRTALLPFCVLPTLALAQTDYFAHQPTWMGMYTCTQGEPCAAYDHYIDRSMGEVVIEGMAYTQVERFGYNELYWTQGQPAAPWCTGAQPYGPYPPRLVRQVGRTIVQYNEGEETLLFDFGLEVGDTVPTTVTFLAPVTIVAVDSIELNGEWRRLLTMDGNANTPYLIEGIGSSNGLFEPFTAVLDCQYIFSCYGLDGTAVYPIAGTPCTMTVGVEPTPGGQPHLQWAPNPAAGHVVVTRPSAEPLQVHLRDARGRLVRTLMLTEARTQIDLEGLPDGVYVVEPVDAQAPGLQRERLVIVL